jgi:glycerol kinase
MKMLDKSDPTISSFITASGGGARGSLLQFISDISGETIRRPKIRDKTAIGVFRILSGNYENTANEKADLFKAEMDQIQASKKIKLWKKIISNIS